MPLDLAPRLTPEATLPKDHANATLVGRVWRPELGGPSVVALRGGELVDVTASFATMSRLCEAADPAAALRAASGEPIGRVADILANSVHDRHDPKKPYLLAPIDLQAIKAAGVTFPLSTLERVIEERAGGKPEQAAVIRAEIEALVGAGFAGLKPGSPEALGVRDLLISKGAARHYLEVGLGPDAEIFTKAQPLSAVGTGAQAGFLAKSTWNNPEPEAVLVIAPDGRIVGATLGNDVNLRDVEGRSALLLSKAKDNNASTAIGPFIRLFDAGFSLDDVRRMEISLRVEGEDGFTLDGHSSMAKISRDPADIAAQLIGVHHQYPDGAVLFLGTLFAPVKDRDAPGMGFTHKPGDVVTISTERLGSLTNRMTTSETCPPWTFGISSLMANLAKRRVI